MLKSYLITLALCLAATGAYAQDITNADSSPCEGVWVLEDGVRWTVTRASDGLELIIPHNATILDCSGNPGNLQEELNNSKAAVWCSNSSEQEGVMYVQKIWITCE
ncbi:MAG: hypothetical protein KUA37_19265 [Desulfomicrobium sp.]|nr:hypothetical protein [Pseudomonadota bacterium]MBV1714110.1 hypothetical protein [Desulfomicrobium sp.]MBU4571647.1 hypothetical protein [Pseudomonadota bacterium]MBU4595795.1 hypothetical protein [Pseudomonadota bacterium]MBV1721713.1 hypothetical protein [Desulfomicrobium sp.]